MIFHVNTDRFKTMKEMDQNGNIVVREIQTMYTHRGNEYYPSAPDHHNYLQYTVSTMGLRVVLYWNPWSLR